MAAQTISLRDAVGRLAEQKTLAESHGAVLKQHVTEQNAIIKGQQLYGEARAKFDALIQRLLFDLTSSSEPKDSAELHRTLEQSIEARAAFCRFVTEHVPREEGTKDLLGIGDALKAGAEIVTKLIEAGVEIWKEYRRGNELKRETIRNQIEAQRWRAFTEL
jgi:hypothetical protein